MSNMISFDPKCSSSNRDVGLRLGRKIAHLGYDVEVAGFIHILLKACGLTQEDLDDIQFEVNEKRKTISSDVQVMKNYFDNADLHRGVSGRLILEADEEASMCCLVEKLYADELAKDF